MPTGYTTYVNNLKIGMSIAYPSCVAQIVCGSK